MSTKPIVQLTTPQDRTKDEILRRRCALVEVFDERTLQVVHDLIDTMAAHRIAVGLAAPQIGVPVAIAVVNTSKGKIGPPLILINPSVVDSSGKKDKGKESCMSVPGVRGEVIRREKATVRYQDERGDWQQVEAKGFLARVILHEVDHLSGRLYLDCMIPGTNTESIDLF
jgi:peptide deformylase